MNVLDWLLEDDAPGVAALARTRLLGESPRSRRVTALRRRCNDYPPVAGMLQRAEKAMADHNNYKKYEGAYWTLIFLAEMQADGRDPRARRLARHVLGTQLENGGFSCSGKPQWEVVCLTANLLRSLVHLGFAGDERIVRGYKRLAERIVPHGGVPCVVLEYSLRDTCKMTLPQTLRALAVAPKGVPRAKLKSTRDALLEEMREVRVYRYVRPDWKDYLKAVAARPKGVTQREVRNQWMKEHRVPLRQLQPKPGWLRFGFPRSYNPDLLEAMLALAELDVPHEAMLDDPLDHIERRRLADGRWKLDDSLNGKMLATIEHKGRPSKWITLRALTVLAHFGRVQP